MAGETLQLWRYTAGKTADDWTKGKSYVMAAESELPEIEKQRGITIDPVLVADDELLAAPDWLYRGPGVFRMKRRARIGKTDATYLQLISEGKQTEAVARADALLAVADAELKAANP